MSCGTCGVGSNQSAAARIDAPTATGAATGQAVRAGDVARNLRACTSQTSRRRAWMRTQACPQCGGLVSREEGQACPLCGDTGSITWDDQALPPAQLQACVIERARRGQPSGDGYLWLAAHMPGLMQDDAVRTMIRAEAAEHPAWALWGRAPDALAQAGMQDVVREAASSMPDAAKVSLRALKALVVQAQGEAQ